ncbi:tRNA (adenosine(37)-N6)-threonylcarbamoyltransferase complex dimerization subunit type 1 TsaB [Gemelliphila palaticanis]|uniref:tRNA (Adenosine(37)-N6)-threonylcarbamoyltransferase complex dimerization subunit type 1 TsaB n=1 Tax=Gemelliphila palaticanis TaxID=81950 RepID=A0ABX2T2D9_9BACL|nr:tRNA (adenosine(37)-N6)-threonylcarbamoyltransferase complex dimerization subunit type 1 TsaB [Gemella palaticanis]MBF0715256.1 tRNA (adenosine(37)-N6)-threonylcarbamoyltransferase complex dimerization subunit type 1 TsaB [Gemella palaticanis]NYS47186.1 tRNA (adenosine(37)-N6)-threonylcarbamoyltransferase complex dimerization subunit type 1 TsaB [Gemella palaticanis]
MVRLILDASNSHLSIALLKNNELINEFNIECKRNLSEILLQEIDNILVNSNFTKNDLLEIIATKGPGSYTALRVVLSVAKTLSMVLNIPIKLISSLRLQAANVKEDVAVVPLIDGRRGNVYAAIYDNDVDVFQEGYYSLDDVINKLNELNKKVIFVGNDVSNFSYDNLNNIYDLDTTPILAKNIIYVEKYLENSDFYNALPSYLRLTEAERNLKNDKN